MRLNGSLPFIAVPSELLARPQWVSWRYQDRAGRLNKTPFRPDGSPIPLDTPLARWGGPFSLASETVRDRPGWGLGYVVLPTDPYCALDLDHSLDPAGQPLPWAAALLSRFQSYSEITPSGSGCRIWIRARRPGPRARRGPLEIYDRARYLTVSGRPLPGYSLPIASRQSELDALYLETFGPDAAPPLPDSPLSPRSCPHSDSEIRACVSRSRDAVLDRLLSGDCRDFVSRSRSEAMAGLLGRLSFYTQDPAQLSRFAESSRIWDPSKWSRLGPHEIRAALSYRTISGEVWDPLPPPEDPEGASAPPGGLDDAHPDVQRRLSQLRIDARARALLSQDAAPPSPAPFEDGASFLAADIPPPAWRIQDFLLADAHVLLAAQYKTGKTTFILNLIRALCDGTPFLDAYPVSSPCTVAYSNLEMSTAQIHAWISSLSLKSPSRLRIQNARGRLPRLDLPAHRSAICESLRGASVWIIDAWSDIFPGDQDSNTESARFLKILDQICASAGVSNLILVHHMGRISSRPDASGFAPDQEHGRGASILDDHFDDRWILVREGESRFIRLSGRALGTSQEWIPLDYDAQFRSLTRGSGSRDSARLASSESRSDARLAAREIHMHDRLEWGARWIQSMVRASPGVSARELRGVRDSDGRSVHSSMTTACTRLAAERGWVIEKTQGIKKTYWPGRDPEDEVDGSGTKGSIERAQIVRGSCSEGAQSTVNTTVLTVLSTPPVGGAAREHSVSTIRKGREQNQPATVLKPLPETDRAPAVPRARERPGRRPYDPGHDQLEYDPGARRQTKNIRKGVGTSPDGSVLRTPRIGLRIRPTVNPQKKPRPRPWTGAGD